MDGFLTKKTVQNVREIPLSTDRKEKMVNLNYEIAARYYSYSVLCKRLDFIMTNYFGDSGRQPYNEAPNQQRVVYLKRDSLPVSYDNFGEQGRRAHA
jgi:hypothetical protein